MNKRNILAVVVMLLCFSLPIIGAFQLYLHPHIWAFRTINHGGLIQPLLKAQDLKLTTSDKITFLSRDWAGHWVLLYVQPAPQCDASCQHTLYDMRQIRLALGKNQDKLLRVLLSVDQVSPTTLTLLQHAFVGTQSLTIRRSDLVRFLSGQSFSAASLNQGQLLVVDPSGYVMMHYPVEIAAKDILADLNRLLQVN